MLKLSGISDFFYGNSDECVTGITLEELDDALPLMEFAIPDGRGGTTTVRVGWQGKVEG